MSQSLVWDCLELRGGGRVAHTEYCIHYALIERVTGLDRGHPDFWRRFDEVWQLDLRWSVDDGPVPWERRGRVTDMGHAEFLADGSDRREIGPCPFGSVDDVLAFDAVAEYGLPDFDELVAYYESSYQAGQAAGPEAVFTGGYYKTIVSGAIQAFGWDLLLEAAADREKFERVLDGFFELSLHHYKAWARTSVKVFICHDDMVWTQGAFIHPDFYRHVIFPRYRKLWAVLKEAGKKVLYCSDGQWTEFVDDIAAAGADGFIFEPMTSFDHVVERYGQTHVIVGSKVDCRTLTFGTREDIRGEIDASLKAGLPCPGWVFAVGNHIAPNVPIDNALYFFEYLSSRWGRE